MFLMPHGMTIDNEGNHYVTDVGLHQVLRVIITFLFFVFYACLTWFFCSSRQMQQNRIWCWATEWSLEKTKPISVCQLQWRWRQTAISLSRMDTVTVAWWSSTRMGNSLRSSVMLLLVPICVFANFLNFRWKLASPSQFGFVWRNRRSLCCWSRRWTSGMRPSRAAKTFACQQGWHGSASRQLQFQANWQALCYCG